MHHLKQMHAWSASIGPYPRKNLTTCRKSANKMFSNSLSQVVDRIKKKLLTTYKVALKADLL